ncbi:MAG: 4Fe-4S dicluster domain-containing protein [Chlorobiaceae bacterium]|nr:4Fe-4S dicluster domain-containing protein [Chlorobiaceae bacterium]
MSEKTLDQAALKKIGMMRQVQPDYYVMRLKAVGGELTAPQLARIAEVAEKYGRGQVHLSTRQGVEIHYVHKDNLEAARNDLADAGVEMGACGPRVRSVVACPGSETCRLGVLDTKPLSREFDARYFKQEMPSKFKIAVTGCSSNCTKANENDIGVRGAIDPRWEADECTDCGLCVTVCPLGAIGRRDGDDGQGRDYHYAIDEAACINCTICTSLCPTAAWAVGRRGHTIFIGGTMGRKPRFASVLKKIVESEDEVYALVEASISWYRENGLKKERFGHTIDRVGLEKCKEEIFARAGSQQD